MDNEYYEDNGLFCNACHWQLESTEDRHEHYRSDWHRYNVKRRCAELPPIPFDLFHRKFEQVRKLKEEADAAANAKIICPLTKREFKTRSALAHFHNSKEYKRQVERFARKEQQTQVDENGETVKRKFVSKHHYVYRLPAPEDDTVTEDDKLLLARDAEAAADEEEEEEVVLGDDGLPILKEGEKAIPVKYSLFDDVGPFKTVRASLNYMMKNFGFYLPLVDYLTDVEGMLEYLGAKIGIGHQCLLCNKRFETTIGCQDHMTSQSHCMVSLSNADEEEEQEFLEYYNFAHNLVESDSDDEMVDEDEEAEAEPRMSREDKLLMKQQQRLRTLQLLGIRKATDDENIDDEDKFKGILTVPTEQPRHVVDMNKTGEITLSDGAVIGTRKRRQAYKAAVFNHARKNDQISLRNQLISQYHAVAPSGHMLKTTEQKATEKSNQQYQKRWMLHSNRQGMNMNLILRKHFVPQVPM